MTSMKEAPACTGARLETVPVMLSGDAFGQLISIVASIGMTLLTLTVAVS